MSFIQIVNSTYLRYKEYWTTGYNKASATQKTFTLIKYSSLAVVLLSLIITSILGIAKLGEGRSHGVETSLTIIFTILFPLATLVLVISQELAACYATFENIDTVVPSNATQLGADLGLGVHLSNEP